MVARWVAVPPIAAACGPLHAGNLKPPAHVKHLQLELPDIASADISKYFDQAYTFIDQGRSAGQGEPAHPSAAWEPRGAWDPESSLLPPRHGIPDLLARPVTGPLWHWHAGVLVHCGAGVSRSACLVMSYIMRSSLWSAKRARDHVTARRSIVCLNDGFWRQLCAMEGPLGVQDR
jgi:dual specificity MAP kinase phosphatase